MSILVHNMITFYSVLNFHYEQRNKGLTDDAGIRQNMSPCLQ